MPKSSPARGDALAVRLSEAAALVSLSEDAFNAYVRPELRIVRVGRVTLYPVSEIVRWVDEHTEPSMAEQLR